LPGCSCRTARTKTRQFPAGFKTIPSDVFEDAASFLLEAGRKQDSVTVLTYAVKLAPDSRTLHQSLGEALERVGDAAKATEACKKALQLLPADSTVTGEEKRALRKELEEHLRKLSH